MPRKYSRRRRRSSKKAKRTTKKKSMRRTKSKKMRGGVTMCPRIRPTIAAFLFSMPAELGRRGPEDEENEKTVEKGGQGDREGAE